MNNERGGGQACKMAALRRTDYVVHKKKFGSYKNRWTKRHLLGFEKNLNNVSAKKLEFGLSICAGVFAQTKGMGFFSQGLGGGGGNKDTPGSPRY